MTYCLHEHRALCTKPDSYWILTYTIFWYNMVGKDHFVLYNTTFCRVVFLLFLFFNLYFIIFYFSFSISMLILVESVVPIALDKTSRGKLISLGLLGACVAFSLLGWIHVFLTNRKWALYTHSFSTRCIPCFM